MFIFSKTSIYCLGVSAFVSSLVAMVGCGNGSYYGGLDAGSSATCPAGGLRCECYPNGTCNAGLACLSAICVSSGGAVDSDSGASQPTTPGPDGGDPTGAGGGSAAGGPAASGGNQTQPLGGNAGTPSGGTGGTAAGSGGGPVGSGGTPSGGTPSTGGSTGSGGTPTGTGGTPTGTGGTPTGTGGTPQTGRDTCNNASPNVVENFVSCDTLICELNGRTGRWYSYASADVAQDFAVRTPPSGWADKSCGAWSVGGPSGATTASTFAGIGLVLKDGSPYDLSGYSGVTIRMEGAQEVTFVVRDNFDGYFGANLSGTATSYTVPFDSLFAMGNSKTASLDLSQAISFGFDAATPKSYGFMIHSITLY